MAQYVRGQTKIYVRDLRSDLWAERTDLYLAGPVVRSAGRVEGLLLRQSYAPGVPEGRQEDLHKYWLKVTYTPDGGEETWVWFGNIEDSMDDESKLCVFWTAVSIEAQLQRIRLFETYAENVDDDSLCQRISLRTFNEDLDDSDKVCGLRSGDSNRYHFQQEKDVIHTRYTGGATLFVAYVFGTDAVWRNYDILEHLLSVNTPWWKASSWGHDWIRTSVCNVPFRLFATTAAEAYLKAAVETWDFTGKSLLGAVRDLVEHSGPLGFYCDATDYLAGEAESVYIVVFSRLYEDKDAAYQGDHEIAKSDCLPAMVRRRVKDRVTQVIARGARLKVMFSVDYNDVHALYYRKDWADAQQSEWLGLPWDERDKKGELNDVYCRIAVPTDVLWPIFYEPDPYPPGIAEAGALFKEQITYTGHSYVRPRPLLSKNLTYMGFTNPTENGGTLPFGPIGTPRAAHDPILCWHMRSGKAIPLEKVKALENQVGIRVPTKYREELPVLCGSDGWQHLLFTCSMETDTNLEWIESVVTTDEQCRTEILEMPECEWWAAVPDTVISVAADGTETHIEGVLRNDLPTLKAAAEARVKMLNGRVNYIAMPHYHGRIPFKDVNLGVGLGDFVKTYGGQQILAPVMTVALELRDMPGQPWSTIETFQPYSWKDLP